MDIQKGFRIHWVLIHRIVELLSLEGTLKIIYLGVGTI